MKNRLERFCLCSCTCCRVSALAYRMSRAHDKRHFIYTLCGWFALRYWYRVTGCDSMYLTHSYFENKNRIIQIFTQVEIKRLRNRNRPKSINFSWSIWIDFELAGSCFISTWVYNTISSNLFIFNLFVCVRFWLCLFQSRSNVYEMKWHEIRFV